jgi:hypothetical protein
MKNIYSCLIVAVVLVSCNNDTDTQKATDAKSVSSAVKPLHRGVNESPGNSDNPYDQAGQLFSELFDAYFDTTSLPTTTTTIAARVESVASASTNFMAAKTLTYHPVSVTNVDYLVSQGTTCISSVLNGTGISSRAKTSLSGFISNMLSLSATEDDYAVIYSYITTYEDGVVADTLLSSLDKKVILTASSITRYSSYRHKKKPKKNTDPEWYLMVSNMTGAIENSPYGVCDAVTTSLAAGVADN